MHFFTKALRRLAVVAVAASFAVAGQARADVILSEDFSSGSLPGWTLNAGTAVGDALLTDLGNNLLSEADTPTLSVVAGATYTLSLDLASGGGCFFSGDCAGPHHFSVFQNGACINGCTNFFPPIVATNRPLTAADFTHESVSFVATSDSLVLGFRDSTPYPDNIGGYGAIDNIVLTGPAPGGVPEPQTWMLALAGFGLAGAALRARRRPAAI